MTNRRIEIGAFSPLAGWPMSAGLSRIPPPPAAGAPPEREMCVCRRWRSRTGGFDDLRAPVGAAARRAHPGAPRGEAGLLSLGRGSLDARLPAGRRRPAREDPVIAEDRGSRAPAGDSHRRAVRGGPRSRGGRRADRRAGGRCGGRSAERGGTMDWKREGGGWPESRGSSSRSISCRSARRASTGTARSVPPGEVVCAGAVLLCLVPPSTSPERSGSSSARRR